MWRSSDTSTSQPEPGGRWLVVRGGALGDFILTLPALERARAAATHLRLCANPRFARLRPDLFDVLHDIHGAEAAALFREGPLPWPVDHALSYTPGVAERLRRAGVPTHAGPPLPAPGEHAQDALLAALADLPGPIPPAPRLWPTAAALAEVAPLVCPGLVVLAPDAAAPTKMWGGFSALGAALRALGHPTLLVTGLDQPPRPAADGPQLRAAPLDLLVALASRCAAWVGNDTGTSHLAAAAGAHCLVFFGPTDPLSWLPRGASSLPMQSSAEDVLEHVNHILTAAAQRRPLEARI